MTKQVQGEEEKNVGGGGGGEQHERRQQQRVGAVMTELQTVQLMRQKASAAPSVPTTPLFCFFFFFPSPVAFFHQLEILGLFPTPSPQEEINLGHHFLHHYPGRRETSFLPTNTPCRMDGWIMMMVGMSGTAEKHFFHCIPYHG